MKKRDRQKRAVAALKSLFVADALAMPVHWFYNPRDIEQAFPGGIHKFEAAPDVHPSSIMRLHSTSQGGRGSQGAKGSGREIVGEVILKGRRKYWGVPNLHYHQQMRAGENTLNAHCARVLMRALAAAGEYRAERFLDDYIAFMTADPPRHPDTYAESFHRGFFANLEAGRPKDRCAAVTHDTPSIGGLVMIAPLVLAERLRGTPLSRVQQLCREHLFLTHPDAVLALVCEAYVTLIDGLLFREESKPAEDFLQRAGLESLKLNLARLVDQARDDRDVLGSRYSTACYISGSWPSALYLAYKYLADPTQGLLANANLGGDNVHCGAVLGVMLGLASGAEPAGLFAQLVDHQELEEEIAGLLNLPGYMDPNQREMRYG